MQGDTPLGEQPQHGDNVPEEHAYPVVEVDESLFTHRTENGVREQVWVLGIFDRGTGNCRMFVVPDRASETLMPIIQENVAEECVIYTDGWAAYQRLADLGYIHRVVVHAHGFGRGLDTTNGIESCWSQVKRLSDYYRGIQGRGPNATAQIQDHINHGIWLRHIAQRNPVKSLVEVVNSIFVRQ